MLGLSLVPTDSKVSEKYGPLYQNLTHISSELEQLRATHSNMIHAKEEALTMLQKELQKVNKTSRQLGSAKHTGMELQRQVESLQEQKVALQSRVTEVGETFGTQSFVCYAMLYVEPTLIHLLLVDVHNKIIALIISQSGDLKQQCMLIWGPSFVTLQQK